MVQGVGSIRLCRGIFHDEDGVGLDAGACEGCSACAGSSAAFALGVEWLHGAKAISAGHCVVLRVSPKVVGVGVCLLEVFICSLHVMPEVVNVVLERAWKFLGGVIMP